MIRELNITFPKEQEQNIRINLYLQIHVAEVCLEVIVNL